MTISQNQPTQANPIVLKPSTSKLPIIGIGGSVILTATIISSFAALVILCPPVGAFVTSLSLAGAVSASVGLTTGVITSVLGIAYAILKHKEFYFASDDYNPFTEDEDQNVHAEKLKVITQIIERGETSEPVSENEKQDVIALYNSLHPFYQKKINLDQTLDINNQVQKICTWLMQNQSVLKTLVFAYS